MDSGVEVSIYNGFLCPIRCWCNILESLSDGVLVHNSPGQAALRYLCSASYALSDVGPFNVRVQSEAEEGESEEEAVARKKLKSDQAAALAAKKRGNDLYSAKVTPRSKSLSLAVNRCPVPKARRTSRATCSGNRGHNAKIVLQHLNRFNTVYIYTRVTIWTRRRDTLSPLFAFKHIYIP